MKRNLNPKLSALLAICLAFTTVISSCDKKEVIDDAKQPEPKTPPTALPTTPVHITNNYTLEWSDDFNGTQLDLTKWNYRAEGVVRNLGTVSRNAISLDGQGNLLITVSKGANDIYYIGQVSTNGLYDTKYGYFECKVKMQESIGPHTAFWLQSNSMGIENNDPQTNGVEIDIFEYHRKVPNRIFHNLHWNGYGANHMTIGTHRDDIPNVGKGYHVFGLEWTPTEYTFYIDGKKTWNTKQAVSQADQYIILSSELTGWGGDPAAGKFPDAVYFDYVKVYKPKK